MEVVERVFPRNDVSNLVAQRTKFLTGESAISPLFGLTFLVLASPFVEAATHFCTPAANLKRAVSFEQVADSIAEMGFQDLPTKILPGAVGAAFVELETLWPRRRGAPV
jgi:hypothetical protein